MGQLRDKIIVQSRNWLDPMAQPIPPFDYDYTYPVTVFDAVKRTTADDSSNLSDELTAIYRLIAEKQNIIQPGIPGQIMSWTGIKGEIGSLEVIKFINTNPAERSHSKIPTEKAVGDLIDTKASILSLNAHIQSNSIHITDVERTRWNAMAPLSTLQAHANNTNVHITNEERMRWNSMASQGDLDNHRYDTNNPHNVTAHQVGSYTRREVDEFFDSLRKSFFNYLNIQWDDRNNRAELVNYHPGNWNPNYVLGYNDPLPDVPDVDSIYFALKPATDYLHTETADVIIHAKLPGLMWQEVGFAVMKAGDMVIQFPGTEMYVWVQGRFIKLFANSTSGEDDTGGINGNIWKPNYNEETGYLTFALSKEETAPLPMLIRGKDGETPVKGIDYVDGKDGMGVPVGGVHGDILFKLSTENYDTTWKSLKDLFDDLVTSGFTLPDQLVAWDKIQGRPEWFNTPGGSDDGFMTQKSTTDLFNNAQRQIDEILTKLQGVGGIEEIGKDLYDHLNDFNNPHRINPAQIGAVTVAAHTTHIQNFNNPHHTTKDHLGLNRIDNTSDKEKPVSDAVQEALDELNKKITIITDEGAVTNYFTDATWDETGSSIRFVFKNGDILTLKIPVNDALSKMYFDQTTKEIIINLPNGAANKIDLKSLLQSYAGSIGVHIQTIVEDGVLKANIIPASITGNELITSIHINGSPTTRTQPVGDISTRIATTEFVKGQVINNLISYEVDRPLSANMGRILNSRKADIDEVLNIISDLEGIDVIDYLDSTNPRAALSANMGRHLDLTKAPRVHTSPSGSTFGCATISLFGHTRASEIDPLMDGTVFKGTDDGRYARADHRHPTDITRAPIHSPDFTGTPTAPTPAEDSDGNNIATTHWVRHLISSGMYGICNTSGIISNKTAMIEGFVRNTGSLIVIKFENEDISSDTIPTTLNVTNTGVADVRYHNRDIEPHMIGREHYALLSFDGESWQLINSCAEFKLPIEDDSNRVPTTEWTREIIEELAAGPLEEHVGSLQATPLATGIGTGAHGMRFNTSTMERQTSESTWEPIPLPSTNIANRAITSIKIQNDVKLDGNPTTTTQPPGTSNNTIATTAFVRDELSAQEEFSSGGGANVMSPFLGFTTEGYGGTSGVNGEVNRVIFTIPFKNSKRTNGGVIVSTGAADWGARMGDNTLINLSAPVILFSTKDHAVIQFTMATSYPSNSPCALVYRSTSAKISVKENTGPPSFQAVTDITNVPSAAVIGTPISLTSSIVEPVNATNQTISWSIVNAGTTGASINTGILSTTAIGTVTIRATIANGASGGSSNYTQNFTIIITSAPIVINQNPVSEFQTNQGAISGSLSVDATITTGILTYQWYQSPSNNNSSGTIIGGATNKDFTIPTSLTAGIYYYFCEISSSSGATPVRTSVTTVRVVVKVTGITLSTNAIDLYLPDSHQLVATINPANATNKNIIWTSSNNAVATVTTTGLVISGGIGTTNITATSEDGNKIATCIVTVKNLIAITNITGISTDMSAADGTLVLSGTIYPTNATNKDIIWGIANSGTTGAYITNGNILNVTSGGIVVVRAMVINGVGFGTSYIQDFSINVESVFVDVINITDVPTVGTVGEEIQLSGTIVPSNSTASNISWEISDPGTTGATITNGNILMTSDSGDVKIRATVSGGLNNGQLNYTELFNVSIKSGKCDLVWIHSALGEFTFSNNIIMMNVPDNTIVCPVGMEVSPGATWKLYIDDNYTTVIDDNLIPLNNVGANFAYLRIMAENGIYSNSFTIIITKAAPPFIPVTDITDVASNIIMMETPSTISLSGTIVPSNSTASNISWEISDPGTTGATIEGNNILQINDLGHIVIKAIISGGIDNGQSDYVKLFPMNILENDADISDLIDIHVADDVVFSEEIVNYKGADVPIHVITIDAPNCYKTWYRIDTIDIDIVGATWKLYYSHYNFINGGDNGLYDGYYLSWEFYNSPFNSNTNNAMVVEEGVNVAFLRIFSEDGDIIREFIVRVIGGPPSIEGFVPVEDINPEAFVKNGSIISQQQTSLTSLWNGQRSVIPSNATDINIIWDIVDPGTTGIFLHPHKPHNIDNSVSYITTYAYVTSPGTATLKATVKNGIAPGVPFTKIYTYTFTSDAILKALTGLELIDGIPTELICGTPIAIRDFHEYIKKVPSDAYQNIIPTIVIEDAGETGAYLYTDDTPSGPKQHLNTTHPGTLKLKFFITRAVIDINGVSDAEIIHEISIKDNN